MMIQKSGVLIVFCVLIGLAFGYWNGQTNWLAPWFPIGGSAGVLVFLISTWMGEPSKETNLTRKTSVLTGFLKWVTWLSMTGYLLCSAIFYWAWNLGLIKYGCMQPETPSMTAHRVLMAHPMTRFAADVSIVLVALNLALIFFNLIYGSLFGLKVRWLFSWLKANRYSTLAILAGLVYIFVSRLIAVWPNCS